MYKIISQLDAHRIKLAGSAIENIFFTVPMGTNLLKFFAVHFDATPGRHTASPTYDAKTVNGDFTSLSFGPGDARSWFSLNTQPSGSFAAGETLINGTGGEAEDRFVWVIQANAAVDTRFFIRIKFFHWENENVS